MPVIIIENFFGKRIEIQDINKTILKHFQDAQLDWMHACGGKGRCTTCKIIIKNGIENMSPLTAQEEKYRAIHALNTNERLSCQAKTTGDVVILVPSEYKLPHLEYSA